MKAEVQEIDKKNQIEILWDNKKDIWNMINRNEENIFLEKEALTYWHEDLRKRKEKGKEEMAKNWIFLGYTPGKKWISKAGGGGDDQNEQYITLDIWEETGKKDWEGELCVPHRWCRAVKIKFWIKKWLTSKPQWLVHISDLSAQSVIRLHLLYVQEVLTHIIL